MGYDDGDHKTEHERKLTSKSILYKEKVGEEK